MNFLEKVLNNHEICYFSWYDILYLAFQLKNTSNGERRIAGKRKKNSFFRPKQIFDQVAQEPRTKITYKPILFRVLNTAYETDWTTNVKNQTVANEQLPPGSHGADRRAAGDRVHAKGPTDGRVTRRTSL